MSLTIKQEAAATLSTAADEIERRGWMKGWFCPPDIAEDGTFQDAVSGIFETVGELPEGYSVSTEQPFVSGEWIGPRIEDETERGEAMKDCKVCAAGAINWVTAGDVEDSTWWYDANHRPNEMSRVTYRAFAQALTQLGETGLSHPFQDNAQSLISWFNDLQHGPEPVVAALRRASEILLT